MTTKAKSGPATTHIELQRTLHGYGAMHEVVEVEDTDEVQALIDQELAVRVSAKDAETALPPEGLQAQPPVTEAGRRAAGEA